MEEEEEEVDSWSACAFRDARRAVRSSLLIGLRFGTFALVLAFLVDVHVDDGVVGEDRWILRRFPCPPTSLNLAVILEVASIFKLLLFFVYSTELNGI